MGDSSTDRSDWVPNVSSGPSYQAETGEAEPSSSGPPATAMDFVAMSPASFVQAAYRTDNSIAGTTELKAYQN
mgnify:CR=1 FL=1